jgi:pimeloyl-ACP methyl ester carboxylesterase
MHPRTVESPPHAATPTPRRGALAALAAAALGACAVAAPDAAHVPARAPTPSGVGAQPPGPGAPASLLPPARQVPTRVGRLAVRDTGPAGADGEVIVLWPSILSDHRIYRAQIEAWRGRHRLVVVDGPGHGDSGPAPGPFMMADCGEALSEVLDALGIDRPVVVVGTSWGGLVAGEFALARPQRTRAVVMLNTPVHTAPGGPGFGDRFVAWGARWIHGTGLYRDGVARAFLLPATRERGGPVLDDFHRHLREADGAALSRSVRAVLIEREPLAPRLRDIAAPTLFVAGRHDTMYPLEGLRDAAATLPRGRFAVLETAHISVMDAPAQATSLIEGFLAGLAPVPSAFPNGARSSA